MPRQSLMHKLYTDGIVVLDGGMGWYFLDKFPTFPARSVWEARDEVESWQEQFVLAGAEIIETPTFPFSHFLLKQNLGADYEPRDIAKYNRMGAEISKRVADRHPNVYVAGAIGPLGQNVEFLLSTRNVLMEGIPFEEAIRQYKERAKAILEGANPDLWLAETIPTAEEGAAAAKAFMNLGTAPIAISYQCENGGMGTSYQATRDIVRTMKTLGVDILGVNCVLPEQAIEAVEAYRSLGWIGPLMVYPNAGKGKYLSPDEMTSFVDDVMRANGNYRDYPLIVGGCCGTDPGHIKAFVGRLSLYLDQ